MTPLFSEKPSRILMTADTIGGVWTYALTLARALEPHGVKVALATMGAPVSEEQRAELSKSRNVTLFESHFPLEWMDDPWPGVDRAGGWLLEVAEQFQPDIIHLNGYAHGALPWRAPVLVAAHSCVLSWWEAVKGEPAPPRCGEYQRRVSAGLRAADFVVAPTRAMLDSLAENYGPLPPSRVIPNGRDSSDFQPAAKQQTILTAGRVWDEAKNVRALDAVAPEVRWPIYVAGETGHPNGGSAHSPGNLFPLGKLSAGALAQRLGAAAIYASPARYEPFGLAALEAGLCGCALVLGDIPSLREVWGDAAIFVSPDDHAALRDALNSLADDGKKCADYGQRARRRALRFSVDAMAAAYLETYARMLAGDRACGKNLEASCA